MTATRDITCAKCGETLVYVRSEQGWMFFRCSTHGIVAIDDATVAAVPPAAPVTTGTTATPGTKPPEPRKR